MKEQMHKNYLKKQIKLEDREKKIIKVRQVQKVNRIQNLKI